MARPRTTFTCSACGQVSSRWLGRCPGCSEWNTLVEEVAEPPPGESRRSVRSSGGQQRLPVPLAQVQDDGSIRIPTGMPEFDRILGGGLTRGSLTLIGGDPGVGKSTLLLQVASGLGGDNNRVLYASGEESAPQVKGRASRLQLNGDSVLLMAETSLEAVIQASEEIRPSLLVVDSVQTVCTADLTSAPGSVSQVREVANRLMYHAKATGVAVMTIGHVTKEGTLAGPRALEHIVDTVVYFEGEGRNTFRLLRTTKNRFGPTGELALFEMAEEGLRAIPDPSAALLAERPIGRPGTAVAACLEGSRPLLVEVQALVARGIPGAARRTAVGLEGTRLAMLVAVMEKEGIPLFDRDIFVNVAGGIRVSETAADLAVILAIASSLRGKAVPGDVAALGEVGLTGEVRGINRLGERVREAARHGFRACLVPARSRLDPVPGMDLLLVSGVHQALSEVLG